MKSKEVTSFTRSSEILVLVIEINSNGQENFKQLFLILFRQKGDKSFTGYNINVGHIEMNRFQRIYNVWRSIY